MPPLVIDSDVRTAFRGARVLVTGGDGFIARHLTAALLTLRADVSLVGRRSANRGGAEWPEVLPLPVGGAAFRSYFAAQVPFDFVFHLAGHATATGSVHAPADDFSYHVTPTLDLLESLRLRRAPTRMVYTSSAAVYGSAAKLAHTETDLTSPISPYGLSKLIAEQYIRLYASSYGVLAATVRPFSVYGPLQTKQVVFRFLCQLVEAPNELRVFGDGSEVRDFVFVNDVVRALLIVATRGGMHGDVYNVATGTGTTVGELANRLIRLRELRTRISFTGSSRPGDQDKLVGAVAKLASVGAAPIWSLNEGLNATLAWFDTLHASNPTRTEPTGSVRSAS